MKLPTLPKNIICLTEESVELLYLLGQSQRIAGVSAFAVRPEGVKQRHPVVSVFTHAQLEKVVALNPDLILGYSDIQKDIARDLIERGQNVWISNHRTLQEVANYCATLAALVGRSDIFSKLFQKWQDKTAEAEQFARELQQHRGELKVYIEEWDEPRISGIHYFSELLELCGLRDINGHLRSGFKARERFADEEHIISENPDLIFGCWCGKRVDIEAIRNRSGWGSMTAVISDSIYELPPEIFLQPGPALFEDGIDFVIKLLREEFL